MLTPFFALDTQNKSHLIVRGRKNAFFMPFTPFNTSALAEIVIHRDLTILANDSFTAKLWIKSKLTKNMKIRKNKMGQTLL